jgi:hypothetical protein
MEVLEKRENNFKAVIIHLIAAPPVTTRYAVHTPHAHGSKKQFFYHDKSVKALRRQEAGYF